MAEQLTVNELIKNLQEVPKETGMQYDALVLIRFPNGEFGLIKEVIALNGVVVILGTLDARRM